MPGADFFEYLSAFITIVLALALSDLIQSTHRLIRARRTIEWDVRPLLLAVYVYLAVLSEFFGLWEGLRYSNFSFLDLLGEMFVPTLTALLAFAVLPDEIPSDRFSLARFYEANRRYLVALIALIFVSDTVRSLLWLYRHGYFGYWQVWVWYSSLALGYAAVLPVIWSGEKRRWQIGALIALNLIGGVAFFIWSIKVTQ